MMANQIRKDLTRYIDGDWQCAAQFVPAIDTTKVILSVSGLCRVIGLRFWRMMSNPTFSSARTNSLAVAPGSRANILGHLRRHGRPSKSQPPMNHRKNDLGIP